MRAALACAWTLALPLGAAGEVAQAEPPAAAAAPDVEGAARRLQAYKPKPYEPPVLEAEPEPEPLPLDFAAVKVVDAEVLVFARPWSPSPMVGALVQGARLAVHGKAPSKNRRHCGGNFWYALGPQAWICSTGVEPTAEPADREPYLRPPPGRTHPFPYVMVGVDLEPGLPMWAGVQQVAEGAEPARHLKKGDTVAVQQPARPLRIAGVEYWQGVDGQVLPRAGTFALPEKTAWQGVALAPDEVLPFGWSLPGATVFDRPEGKRKKLEQLAPRTRVPILEEHGAYHRRWLRIGEGRWVRASQINEVRREGRPETAVAPQWIDVDLGEQVLVAYEGDRPAWATLISSGRAVPTPRGDYPVWAKIATITMKNQAYEDDPYFVDKVPWVIFFQGHNALHGAYWHDRFGRTKSHGCVNLAPGDARHLFEWLAPAPAPGWHGWRPINLLESPIVRVRNSALRRPYAQERPIGPPDKELEKLKLEHAEAVRAVAPPGGPAPAGSAPSGP